MFVFKNINIFNLLISLFFIQFVKSEEPNQVSEYSLKNLVTISSINEISDNWIHLGESIYEEGRIILTPKPIHVSVDEQGLQFGSIWSSNSKSLDSFTIELTIRSLGNFGLTNAGFSFFLIDGSSADITRSVNFGGPSHFKGLQLLLNLDEKLGPVLRPYLNDGSKKIDINNDYLGAYIYEYQNSQVPTTIKIAFENKFFKITCDNKLLFESNEINFSDIINSNNLKIGISALSSKNMKLHEQFEILKLSTYDKVLDEMKIDNDETLIAKHGNNDENSNNARSSKFLQQQQKLRQRLATQQTNSNLNNEKDLQIIKDSLDSILSVIEKNDVNIIQTKLSLLSGTIDKLTNNYVKLEEDFIILNNKYVELSNLFKKQFDLLDNYDTSLRSFDKVLQNQLRNSDNLDNKLSTISNYYSSMNDRNSELLLNSTNDDSLSKLKSLIYMIFLPLLLLLGLVALWIHKLRNDIKHSKVL